MTLSVVDSRPAMTNGVNAHAANGASKGGIDRMNPHDFVRFDPSLTPKKYEIKGTDPNSKVLFRDVSILDSTGRDAFKGDVYIEGERIKYVGSVPDVANLAKSPNVRVVEGHGRTLMSGLGDAHTHFSWNNGDLGKLGELGVEEHTLMTAQAAKTYIDSGYTMCYGAAAAKERLDIAVRDAINNGSIPGPRYLANGKEMAVPDGDLIPGITAFAKGPLEMREVIRHHVALGVDNIKLSMSGEQITETRDAQDCYYSDEETAACVDEAHRNGVRLCAHARARDSVKMCIRHGVDVIYHASWIDDEGMEMLDAAKDKHIVAPGINWLVATIYEAGAFGYSFEKAEAVGYKKELDVAIKGLKEMHRRGITVLPGGDYGFAWTPHGTYARDLEHFVDLLDFTPMESIVAATAGVAKLFMREDELGKIQQGYYADCILVNGDPVKDITILQDHSKLDVIMINGRVHKASYKEFLRINPTFAPAGNALKPDKFVAYLLQDGTDRTRVGHLNQDKGTITPLSFASGTPVENLYQVIEAESAVIPGGEPFILDDDVHILPPISGRDVLAVGKNYSEHAKEFNASGYDSSDKVDMPSHPVIFTKRATSIIANEEDILLHEDFTQTLDYEGEIGVIVGRSGFNIPESEAEQHVWGYTIINDVTAREKQRDHKQFYIGKSADSYCPIGPLAVPKEALGSRTLTVTTHVNGELRQKGTTEDLIFSIPQLISTLSQSQTLREGDIIATGTPAGVGFGLNPPVFLKPGDVVEVSVTGLGTLRNRVVKAEMNSHVTARIQKEAQYHIPVNNLSITSGGLGLTTLAQSKKKLNVYRVGAGSHTLIFVHGLGGSINYYVPLLQKLGLDREDHPTYTSVLFDLEGHGLSPTKATSKLSIESYTEDLYDLIQTLDVSTRRLTLVAHSMGCLVASLFASQHRKLVSQLVLIGPPPCPLPAAGAESSIKRAAIVRAEGMRNVARAVAVGGTSAKTKKDRTISFTAVLMSLLSQDPEGYAKGCTALSSGKDVQVDLGQLGSDIRSLVITGAEDAICPAAHAHKLAQMLQSERVDVLPDVGHWHVFEDVDGVCDALKSFLNY